MIDLHCHVLPGIDDGPASAEESLALVREARAAGTDVLVATPHVSWRHPNTAAVIARLVDELSAAIAGPSAAIAGPSAGHGGSAAARSGAPGLAAAPEPVELLPGAEIASDIVPDIHPDELRRLALGHSACLLIEPPMTSAGPGLELVVADLQRRGHRVLLAHPERCPLFQRDPGRLRALVGSGALTSVTAGAFSGRFGGVVRRFAHALLADGLVHSVASDFHDLAGRPPGVLSELEDAGLTPLADWLTREVPAAILEDRELPRRPELDLPPAGRRDGWWQVWRRRGPLPASASGPHGRLQDPRQAS